MLEFCRVRLVFPPPVSIFGSFRSLLVHSFQVCVICEGVFKSCLLYSMLSGLLVIPGVSTLPCLPLMLSLKTIILKYLLVCVFLVSPCCVHRDSMLLQNIYILNKCCSFILQRILKLSQVIKNIKQHNCFNTDNKSAY